jgi:hypothetical protein
VKCDCKDRKVEMSIGYKKNDKTVDTYRLVHGKGSVSYERGVSVF